MLHITAHLFVPLLYIWSLASTWMCTVEGKEYLQIILMTIMGFDERFPRGSDYKSASSIPKWYSEPQNAQDQALKKVERRVCSRIT